MKLVYNFCTIVLLSTYVSIRPLLAQETAQKKGKLAGKVIDGSSSEEIIGATVAIEGTAIGAATDLDGRYFLSIAPGTYTVVVSYVSYKSKKYEGIVIKSGELTSLNISLIEDTKQLDEVVVKGEAKRESTEGLLLQQRNAVAVSSGISADLIRKMPDRTTADVVKRISGTSIQDGKFAVIRGLQDRYNYGMINGTPLPSSETDRKAFSLDIVPAQVVDNIIINKTATADMPGDFAGGIIQINTRDIPDENTRFINLGIGGHSLTTFKDFYKSPQASGTDWLGFDNGPRQLPQSVADLNWKTSIQYNPLAPADAISLNNQTNAFNNNFAPVKVTALPNFAFQAGASQRWKLFGNDFGLIAAITYNNSLKNIPTYITNFSTAVPNTAGPTSDHSFNPNNDPNFHYNEYINSQANVNAGSILNFSYKVGQNNKFFFKNLLTQNSENKSYIRNSLNTDQNLGNGPLQSIQYVNTYNSNRMYSGQFGGEHYLEKSKIKLKYTLGYNNLYRNVPDFKYLTYLDGAQYTAPYASIISSTSGSTNPVYTTGRFFSKLNEYSYSANVEVSAPFYMLFKHELKVGGMYQNRERDFKSRTFVFAQTANALSNPQIDSLSMLSPANIFQPQNISAKDKFYQSENTAPYNNYLAGSTLYAGFIMLESKFTSKFRAIYGLRFESFNQRVNTRSQVGDTVAVNTTWNDPLPSVNLIYALKETMNLRGSYSRTVSRPEFREYAPLAFYDININAIVVGNSDLQRAKIDNFDFKYEFYPGAGSVFSINPFLKLFSDPVELTVGQGNQGLPQYTYQNAKSATNYGVEFEVRINPSLFSKTISQGWKNFTAFTNLALIKSSVDLSNTLSATTSPDVVTSRPLQGQSPYVFNAGIQYANEKRGWDFTLTGNQVGRRIAYVSNVNQFLVWENPRFILDLSVTKSFHNDRFKLRAIGGDLLAQDLVFYTDINSNGSYDSSDLVAYKYRNGQTVMFQAIVNF